MNLGFHSRTLGILIMAIFIPLGPLVGTLGWLFVPKGKAKKLTLGVIAFGLVYGHYITYVRYYCIFVSDNLAGYG